MNANENVAAIVAVTANNLTVDLNGIESVVRSRNIDSETLGRFNTHVHAMRSRITDLADIAGPVADIVPEKTVTITDDQFNDPAYMEHLNKTLPNARIVHVIHQAPVAKPFEPANITTDVPEKKAGPDHNVAMEQSILESQEHGLPLTIDQRAYLAEYPQPWTNETA